MDKRIKGQIITITGVDTLFELQQVIRGLRFVVHAETCDGEKVDLNFDAVSVTAKFVHTSFSWRYPEVSDSFCQLCDLMVALKCQSIHTMVGKMLFLNTYGARLSCLLTVITGRCTRRVFNLVPTRAAFPVGSWLPSRLRRICSANPFCKAYNPRRSPSGVVSLFSYNFFFCIYICICCFLCFNFFFFSFFYNIRNAKLWGLNDFGCNDSLFISFSSRMGKSS